MRYNIVFSIIGANLRYISVLMLIPCVFALFYAEHNHILPFVISGVASLLLGLLFNLFKVGEKEIDNLKKTEALFVVFFSWVFFALVASFPYLFYKIGFVDAIFEAVSGITTTGATILQDFSLYPKTLFFYRSMTQWFGGMGIVVLFIAVLPKFAVAGRQMFSAEAPGPTEEKVTPRIRHTASWLWTMYLGLTILQIISLKLCGMDMYDAICNSLSTLSSGGFSPNPTSIMGYQNSKVVIVTSIFMFLAGANFILQYKVFIQHKFKEFLKSEEFLTYLGITIVFSAVIALILNTTQEGGYLYNFMHSSFTTLSLMTTTGFASSDFVQWDTDAKILLFIVTFLGGCAASTAGGMKIIRWIFLVKYLRREILKINHPNGVFPIKLEGRAIGKDVINQMMAFCLFYFLIFILSSFVVALIEKNSLLAVSGSIATLGNVGPGLVECVGPMDNFFDLALGTKLVFIFNMLVGRLELIPFLALLHREIWTPKQ